mmetsp:Transcript_46345/g.104473  ORF Transcript_46345/g.104473 Transcript_46345/m.104473 type:complete len:362 (-) Transcript_46345:665-1750(-)
MDSARRCTAATTTGSAAPRSTTVAARPCTTAAARRSTTRSLPTRRCTTGRACGIRARHPRTGRVPRPPTTTTAASSPSGQQWTTALWPSRRLPASLRATLRVDSPPDLQARARLSTRAPPREPQASQAPLVGQERPARPEAASGLRWATRTQSPARLLRASRRGYQMASWCSSAGWVPTGTGRRARLSSGRTARTACSSWTPQPLCKCCSTKWSWFDQPRGIVSSSSAVLRRIRLALSSVSTAPTASSSCTPTVISGSLTSCCAPNLRIEPRGQCAALRTRSGFLEWCAAGQPFDQIYTWSPDGPSLFDPSPDDPSPDGPSPDGPSPDGPTDIVALKDANSGGSAVPGLRFDPSHSESEQR